MKLESTCELSDSNHHYSKFLSVILVFISFHPKMEGAGCKSRFWTMGSFCYSRSKTKSFSKKEVKQNICHMNLLYPSLQTPSIYIKITCTGIIQMQVLFEFVVENMPLLFTVSAGGGEMISDVFLDHSTYADPPSRLVVCILLSLKLMSYSDRKTPQL